MNDLTFGFLHKGTPVDLIDNEFMHMEVYKEITHPDDKREEVDIGIRHCQHTSHLAKIYT